MKYAIDGNYVFVRLFRGEEVFSTLESLVRDQGWEAGFVSGIGAIEAIELGAYDLEKREYYRREISAVHELSSLQGNFCRIDGEPFFHLHGVISDHSLQTLAGHFFRFTVAATVEVKLRIFPQKVTREYDDEIGLKLLSFCPLSQ